MSKMEKWEGAYLLGRRRVISTIVGQNLGEDGGRRVFSVRILAQRVESRCGAVSSENFRFHIPLFKPEGRFSRIRLPVSAGGQNQPSDSAKRNVATSCSLKLSHPMGGLFPSQVVIAPYRLWCLGRSGRSQVLNVNDKFMRMNTTMCP